MNNKHQWIINILQSLTLVIGGIISRTTGDVRDVAITIAITGLLGLVVID